MTRLIFILLLSLGLSGCWFSFTKQEQPALNVVPHVQYVIKVPPAESLSLPPPADKIDVDAAKNQSEIAKWILSSEKRSRLLEDKLISISSFFKSEQDKLDELAAKQNADALVEANKQQKEDTAAALAKKVK